MAEGAYAVASSEQLEGPWRNRASGVLIFPIPTAIEE